MEGYMQLLIEACEALENNNTIRNSQEAKFEHDIMQFQNEDSYDMPLYNLCEKIENQIALLSELLPEEIYLQLFLQKSCVDKTEGTSS